MLAVGRGLFALLGTAAVAACPQAGRSLAVGAIAGLNILAAVIEVLITRQAARGSIVDVDPRDAAVRPLLTLHVVVSLAELCAAVLALHDEAYLEEGTCRAATSIRLLAVAYALGLGLGCPILGIRLPRAAICGGLPCSRGPRPGSSPVGTLRYPSCHNRLAASLPFEKGASRRARWS